MPHGGVPLGITACLARECLQASEGVNGSVKHYSVTALYFIQLGFTITLLTYTILFVNAVLSKLIFT